MSRIWTVFSVMLLTAVVGSHLLQAAADMEISGILEKTAAYCERLQKKVFHFICDERVVERTDKYIIRVQGKSGLRNFLENRADDPKIGMRSGDRYMHQESRRDQAVNQTIKEFHRSRKSIFKFEFLNEYQIIKEEDQIKEQRRLKRLNGKDPATQEKRRQTIVYSYQNALFPIYLFARENQPNYDYRILGEDKVQGRKAFEVEVRLKGGPEPVEKKKKNKKGETEVDEHLLAIGWVDEEDFSILKFKVYPSAFGGYSHLVRTDMHDFSGILVSDVHYFGQERDGIRFPSRTEILLSYNQDPKKKYKGKKRIPYGYRIATRIGTNFYYQNYRFFEVNVTDPQFIDLEQ